MIKFRKSLEKWTKNQWNWINYGYLEQSIMICDKYVQIFKKTARKSGYNNRLLIKEFKKKLQKVIWWKLGGTEEPQKIIKEWYKYAIQLDRNWHQYRTKERIYRKRTTATTAGLLE